MNAILKHYLLTIGRSVLFWALAMFLWGLFRFYGLEQVEGIHIETAHEELQLKNVHRLFAFSGILLGLVFGHLGYFFEKYTAHKLSIGANVLLKAFLYLVTIIAITTIIKFLAKERL